MRGVSLRRSWGWLVISPMLSVQSVSTLKAFYLALKLLHYGAIPCI